jgi:hypothetical protein
MTGSQLDLNRRVKGLINQFFASGEDELTLDEFVGRLEEFAGKPIVILQYNLPDGYDAISFRSTYGYVVAAKIITETDILPVLHELAHILCGDLEQKPILVNSDIAQVLRTQQHYFVACRRRDADNEHTDLISEQEVEFIARRLVGKIALNSELRHWWQH